MDTSILLYVLILPYVPIYCLGDFSQFSNIHTLKSQIFENILGGKSSFVNCFFLKKKISVQYNLKNVCRNINENSMYTNRKLQNFHAMILNPTYQVECFLTVHCFEKVVCQGQFSINKLQIGHEIADNTKCNDT